MARDQIRLHQIEQMRLRDTGRLRAGFAEGGLVAFAIPFGVFDVVQRHVEAAHAQRAERIELAQQGLGIGRIGEAHRGARRNRIDEIDVITLGGGGQLAERLQGRLRVRLAPAIARVRVVLRAVNEGIGLGAGEEIDVLAAIAHRPRRAVEAFDGAADRHGRVILDRQRRDGRPLDQLPQRLRRMKQAIVIVAGQRDQAAAIARNAGQRVAFLMGVLRRLAARQRIAHHCRIAGAEHDVRAVQGGRQACGGRNLGDAGAIENAAHQRHRGLVRARGDHQHRRAAQGDGGTIQRDRDRSRIDRRLGDRFGDRLRQRRGSQAQRHQDRKQAHARLAVASLHSRTPVLEWYYALG